MAAAEPGQVSRVGIVGAGVIGGGWALHFLRMGLDVDVYDPAPHAQRDLLRMLDETWPLLERMGLRAGASPAGSASTPTWPARSRRRPGAGELARRRPGQAAAYLPRSTARPARTR